MKILEKTYKFIDYEKKIRFFPNCAEFIIHIKHFKDPTQPWRLLPNGDKIISHCQNYHENDVRDIEEIYKLVIPIVQEGMEFAVKYPLYKTFSEKKTGGKRTQKTILLTHFGFMIVLNKKTLVSAYFVTNNINSSLITCFINAFDRIKNRKRITENNIRFVTPEHWETMPNVKSLIFKTKYKIKKKRQWKILRKEFDKLDELLWKL